MQAGLIQSCPSEGYEDERRDLHPRQSAPSGPPMPTSLRTDADLPATARYRLRRARIGDRVNGWAIAAGVVVLGLAGLREAIRWRGRRWRGSGPRGTGHDRSDTHHGRSG